MKIYRPVASNQKTQGFGESDACAKGTPIKIINKKNGVCPAGYVDFYTTVLGMKGHNGEDWATAFKDPNYFPVEADTGWYARPADDSDGGIGLDVYSKKRIFIDMLPPQAGAKAKKEWREHKGFMYVKFRFWHHHSNLKVSKAPVVLGEKIALCDSTGASGGNHLHWSMKFVDSNDKTLDTNNGYTGAVDFSRWYENTFILDELAKRKVEATAAVIKEEIETLPVKEQPPLRSLLQRLLDELARIFFPY
jgi:hypothetical protein